MNGSIRLATALTTAGMTNGNKNPSAKLSRASRFSRCSISRPAVASKSGRFTHKLKDVPGLGHRMTRTRNKNADTETTETRQESPAAARTVWASSPSAWAGNIKTASRTGEKAKSKPLPTIVPIDVSASVRPDGCAMPLPIKLRSRTIPNSARKRRRLTGAALRNSTMLGLSEKYSRKIKSAAKIDIKTVICAESADTPGSVSAGIATTNATKTPRSAAPVIRAIMSLPFQTGQPRYRVAHLFQLDPVWCDQSLIVATILPQLARMLKCPSEY